MIVLLVAILFFSIIIHEFAHGYVAHKLGDPTPKESGRLTLNPFAHIDIFGTIVLPVLLLIVSRGLFSFGYAKPININPYYFKYPKKDMMWVALSGPMTNLAFALFLRLFLFISPDFLIDTITQALIINLVLAVFNFIPIPPLDGSRVLSAVLPYKWAYKYLKFEIVGIFVISLLILMGLLRWFIEPFVGALLSMMGLRIPL